MKLAGSQKKSSLNKYLIGLFSCVVISFIAFNIYPIIHGPQLSITTISNGELLKTPVITLSGKAEHTKELFVNGAVLPISPDGMFEKKIVLSEGYNTLTISGIDRYGKQKTNQYSLVLNEPGAINLTLLESQNSYPY